VTGHNSAGIAKVLMDGEARNAKFPTEGLVSTLLWCTDRTPADIAVGESVEDMGARIIGTPPPPRGSRFCVMEFAAGTRSAMHRTESVDYIVMLSGEIDMEMDNSIVTLRAGDVMVQRGTNHAWINNGTEPARFAVVLIDAGPLGIGRPVSQAETAR
jgi:quercetin dioxygenase-like cupin family protein